jgi:ABC-type polysaccharide/polyol phosphate transport system ATPase subunit
MSETATAIRLDRVRKTFARERNPKSLFRAFKGQLGNAIRPTEGVLALDSITCDIAVGDKVALIGTNGSGKTTLLKVIAGLYRPNAGTVRVDGDATLVAGLGLGMIDELTVEDNLVLYGAIYGLDRYEVRAKLSNILEWAELSDFRSARLKTLSTGMRSRLAFSAMRHIETSIYLMDEVLSAGDRHFSKKCEAVFDDYRSNPKTYVIATHDVKFAARFCNRALWLHKGKQKAFGEPEAIAEAYMSFRPE